MSGNVLTEKGHSFLTETYFRKKQGSDDYGLMMSKVWCSLHLGAPTPKNPSLNSLELGLHFTVWTTPL